MELRLFASQSTKYYFVAYIPVSIDLFKWLEAEHPSKGLRFLLVSSKKEINRLHECLLMS